MNGITDDLTNGFDMVGKVRPGPGWRKRTDGRYNDPEHMQDVCRRNRQYVQNRLQRPTPSQHAKQLLQELVEEQRLGRVVGPLRAPADWPCQTVALPHISGCDALLDAPAGQFLAAASFPTLHGAWPKRTPTSSPLATTCSMHTGNGRYGDQSTAPLSCRLRRGSPCGCTWPCASPRPSGTSTGQPTRSSWWCGPWSSSSGATT